MKKQLLLKIEENQLEKIREAAGLFHEPVSAFLLNAALLRMQSGATPLKEDPFEEALRRMRAERPPVPLSAQAQTAVRDHRKKVSKGQARGVDAAEGAEQLRRRIGVSTAA